MTNPFGSILAVDFGNVHTRAVLIDLVEGVYKPVAFGEVRTTGGFPHGDVSVGLTRALRQITRATGRHLLGADGRVITPEGADRSGVDTYLITTSIGRPLRAVVIGLTPEMSVASAQRAVAGTYVQVVDTLTLEDERSENDHLNAIVLNRPDLIFIAGGTEGGARATLLMLARRAALALSLIHDNRQRFVLYAGNSTLIPEIQALFKDRAQVILAQNVRPSALVEDVLPASSQLTLAYDRIAEERGAGFDRTAEGSALGVLATAQSYSMVVRYLARISGSALSLDMGSGVSTLAAAIGDRSTTTIRSDIGLGHSAASLLDSAGIASVRRWLPLVLADDEIRAYALNKTLRPGTLPENLRELYIEHAFLRAGARELVMTASPLWSGDARPNPDAALPPFDTVIAAGAAFANTGRPGLSAMLLLDALQPTGVTDLLLDNNALIPALGVLARVQQEAFVQLLDEGGIMSLGTCLSVDGSPRAGRTALRVRITLPNGSSVRQEIPGGALWVYPLPLGVKAMIDVRATSREAAVGGKRTIRMEVTGGTAGIIFDARGRPLPLGVTPAERAAQLPAWYAQATGDEIRPVRPEWLEPPAREAETPGLRESLRGEPRAEPRARRAATAPEKERSARRLRQSFKGDAQPETNAGTEAKEDVDELRNLLS
jgi:hypothetical protein